MLYDDSVKKKKHKSNGVHDTTRTSNLQPIRVAFLFVCCCFFQLIWWSDFVSVEFAWIDLNKIAFNRNPWHIVAYIAIFCALIDDLKVRARAPFMNWKGPPQKCGHKITALLTMNCEPLLVGEWCWMHSMEWGKKTAHTNKTYIRNECDNDKKIYSTHKWWVCDVVNGELVRENWNPMCDPINDLACNTWMESQCWETLFLKTFGLSRWTHSNHKKKTL